MLMLDYPLYDFQATVPSCLQTSSLAVVLEIFEQQQCDRLVVVNQQQCPIGLLYSARLIPKLLAHSDDKNFNLHQSLSTWGQGLIEPIQTILASERVEQLSLHLCYPEAEHQNLDWALIDFDGRYLGLLDSSRLLRSLAKERMAGLQSSGIHRSRHEPNEAKSLGHQPLIHLLERLPWPLMLQTGTGEVVARNPAWWQQLGTLKDPEGVRQQVEAILVSNSSKISEYATQRAIKVHPNGRENEDGGEESAQQEASPETAYSRCYLDSQVGTCTCVVEVQNGQERIWQFAKIPLDSPEFQVMSAEKEVALSDDLWLVLATDVTEQQQLCKELAAKNADLIQLNRLKDEFLACISHELKTPLTAVLGLSRLLVDQQLGELNERQARYAGLIHQSGRHLMSVVNDILDLTRMETGQMDLTLTPVKIQTVCDRALSEAKAIHTQTTKATSASAPANAPSSAPQFCLSIELGLDQMVADELRLRQMLVHLLSNAFKFTEISGEIGLRVSRWEGWIAFTVWDTGIGIPEHQQHLIFQKFQQLENPLTRQFEGTGLGLVLTRALARLHGGDVSFLSREGKGSQFTLLLPPSPPKTGFSEPDMGIREDEETRFQQTRENSSAARPHISTPTQHHLASSQRLVLVVEAVARYIEDLTEQLKGLGYRVVIARSGTEAVEKARRLQPIAIFLNPLLPLLSGWDVLTLLKSDTATRHISVIVTATGAEKEQAFANRADGFLSLPVEHQVLTPVLEKLCTVQAVPQQGLNKSAIIPTKTPLRILRLVNPQLESVNPHPSLREHRVIEVDDLDQAELLARVWQFDVILLDVESTTAQIYLQQLIGHPRLAAIPLVTCDVATTLIASKIPGLSVFPYLTPFAKDKNSRTEKTDALLSVLEIASGICCPPNILVVDLTMLRDIPQVRRKPAKGYRTEKNCSISSETAERGSEWFQALIQYLQTAGFKAAMSPCWAEVLQQIRHQSVDLLLICLGESAIHKDVLKALKTLADSPLKLPPILVLNQRLNRPEISFQSGVAYKEIDKQKKNSVESIETVVGAIATQILPRSISMEDLLNQINQALAVNGYNDKC
ncbi:MULTISPECIES: hybrid sensor histidine kinase/response regulator [unclassified Nostoc]|uniref:ATP-binding response regulator n=1 Tax=unclassified Nostoc TaxID=2593658 RepID=UPI002AD39455|nr:hybrid sensor histidine kinase/response regulator [Nostoc sp. DedQUE03]MDZ7976005.1 hybrid sensor histidine kinase/response regulator [Nostoc sp. DedQUE03]MDZ8044835.1 hybrid sensor histidine kinase/response regulator [Nostoc sp. DedQUE02]